jgi:hypothetical protein
MAYFGSNLVGLGANKTEWSRGGSRPPFFILIDVPFAKEQAQVRILGSAERCFDRVVANDAGVRQTSCLFALAGFPARTRGRVLLHFAPIVIDGGADQAFQSPLIDLVAIMDIDGTSGVAVEAGIEEA